MSKISSEALDNSVAQYLVTPNSRQALIMAREARSVEIIADAEEDEVISKLAKEYRSDCQNVFDSALILESDPEIVNRNLVARVISGVFPVLNAVEEFRSFEDRTIYDMLLNSFGVLAEVATATQYLEATRLSANARSERSLMEVENRLVDMAIRSEKDTIENKETIEIFLDKIRGLEIAPREKPFIPFILWSIISLLSYRNLKEEM